MIQTIFSFFKSNLALIISVISLFLSLYNFIYSIISNRKKIEFTIIKYKELPLHGCIFYQFEFIITNKSQLPISINNFSLNDVFCKFDPTRITNHTSTVKFPISLSSLESKSGWLEFKLKDKIDLNSMKFNIHTSRGLTKNIAPDISNMINAHPIN